MYNVMCVLNWMQELNTQFTSFIHEPLCSSHYPLTIMIFTIIQIIMAYFK